jgi:hypothetical protein
MPRRQCCAVTARTASGTAAAAATRRHTARHTRRHITSQPRAPQHTAHTSPTTRTEHRQPPTTAPRRAPRRARRGQCRSRTAAPQRTPRQPHTRRATPERREIARRISQLPQTRARAPPCTVRQAGKCAESLIKAIATCATDPGHLQRPRSRGGERGARGQTHRGTHIQYKTHTHTDSDR